MEFLVGYIAGVVTIIIAAFVLVGDDDDKN